MGRVKKYSSGSKSHRSKSTSKINRKSEDAAMQIDDDNQATSKMSLGKRKQIFKKSKEGRHELKKQILELKRQSSKLRKKYLDQKSQKKQISKQIKQIKVSSFKQSEKRKF